MPEQTVPPYVPAPIPVGFRPGQPPPRLPRTILGKLVFNGVVEADPRYKEAAKIVGSCPQWRMDFEAQDVVRHDGTPAMFNNSANLQDKQGNLQAEGSVYHQMWQLFAAAGVDIDPNTQPGPIGHFFRLTETPIAVGRFKANPLWAPMGPQDYFGTTCPPIAERRVLPPPADSQQPGVAEGAPGVVIPASGGSEDAIAVQLAILLHNSKKEDAPSLVVNSTLRTVTNLFGHPMVQGLTGDVPIIQELISRGLLVESGGVLICTQSPPA